jgi:EpsD family peptidyl-prolyl cis-trans isomerase
MRPDRRLRLAAAAAAAIVIAGCSVEAAMPPGLVTPSEIHAFYVSHPALFEGRRLYCLREIVVEAPSAVIAGLEGRVQESRSLHDVESWLAERGVAYQSARVTHAAEDVPLRMLTRFAAMRPGDLAVLTSSEGAAAVWELVAASDSPLSEEEARPVIEQFLAGHRRASHLRYAST